MNTPVRRRIRWLPRKTVAPLTAGRRRLLMSAASIAAAPVALVLLAGAGPAAGGSSGAAPPLASAQAPGGVCESYNPWNVPCIIG